MHPKISSLLARGVYVGTSSWKYEGWKGLVYQKAYRHTKDFNENVLAEYAEHYTAVGVDHTFYTWPTEKGFQKYVDQTPEWFRFGVKVTERVTIWQYPKLSRYGKEAGNKNEFFLNPHVFIDQFLGPLTPFKGRIGPVMLEFSHFYPGTIGRGSDFVDKLDHFFDELGEMKHGWQLAVEIRNQTWLRPPYFEMLKRHGVAHVFNSWTKMPTLGEQLELSSSVEMPFYVERVLLQPGTKYEQAVEAFSPYDKICQEQPELRRDAAQIARHAMERRLPVYLFVNNRAEGCAPKTLEGILDFLD